jgi:hypothetical protein
LFPVGPHHFGDALVRSNEARCAPSFSKGEKHEEQDYGLCKTVAKIVAAGVLVCAGVAYAQTEKRVIEAPREAPIKIDKVTLNSPTINLKDVGNDVAPGVVEVAPSSIRGKQLVLSPGGAGRHVCIGKWNAATKTCEGVLIQG